MEKFLKEKASRRAFLTKGCLFLTSFGIFPGFFDSLTKKAWAKRDTLSLREAMFYKRLANNIVQCGVCSGHPRGLQPVFSLDFKSGFFN